MKREIVGSRLLFLGAAAFAALTLVLPFLPGMESYEPLEVVTATALVLASVATLGGSVFLASGAINTDLAENRAGFYLAQPTSVYSIWLGKVLALFLIALALGFIVVIVPTAFGGGLFVAGEAVENVVHSAETSIYSPAVVSDFPALWVAGLSMIFAVSLSLYGGLALRSRSPWLLLDAATVSAVILAVWSASHPFLLDGEERIGVLLATGSIPFVSVALMAGHARGFARGRTDLTTAHRHASIATGLLLILIATGVTTYSRAVRTIDPGQFIESELLASSSRSDWIVVAGTDFPSRGTLSHDVQYLLNVQTGAQRKLEHAYVPRVAGKTVAWWQRQQYSPALGNLRWLDLDNPDGEPNRETIWLDVEWLETFFLSPEGDQAAWVDGLELMVYDLREGRQVFSYPFRQQDTVEVTGRLDGRGHVEVGLRRHVDDDWWWSIYRVDLAGPPGELSPIIEVRGHSLWFEDDRYWVLDWADDETDIVTSYDPLSGALVSSETLLTDVEAILQDGRRLRVAPDSRTVVVTSRMQESQDEYNVPFEVDFLRHEYPYQLEVSPGWIPLRGDRGDFLFNVNDGRTLPLGWRVTLASNRIAHVYRPGAPPWVSSLAFLDPETLDLRLLTGPDQGMRMFSPFSIPPTDVQEIELGTTKLVSVDVDSSAWFRFVLTEANTIRILAQREEGDPILSLFRARGSVNDLLEVNDNSGGNVDSGIVRGLPAGEYLLQVSDFVRQKGLYRVTLEADQR